MAHSSFEIDYSLSRRHNLAPASSPSTSHHMSRHYPTPRRNRNPFPPTPFASDNDTSWQSEVSWHFEPTGWRDSNLSAALTPWTANTRPERSPIFHRSANDYYLSRKTGFRSPINDFSGFSHVQAAGRLELQSYVARDNESFINSGEYSSINPHGFSKLEVIKEGIGGNGSGPLANKDEPNIFDYDPLRDIEDLHLGLSHGDHGDHHHGHGLSHGDCWWSL